MKQSFNKKKQNVVGILNNTFQILLVLFLLTLLLQVLKPNFVEYYINMNYFLVIVIVFGIAAILTSREEKVEREEVTKKDYGLAVVAGTAGTLIIWYKIMGLGWMAYVISVFAGLLIVLLSILLLEGE